MSDATSVHHDAFILFEVRVCVCVCVYVCVCIGIQDDVVIYDIPHHDAGTGTCRIS